MNSETVKSLEEMLSSDGIAVHNIQGRSMYPLLSYETDRVLLAKPGDLKLGDIALYKRNGAYVLHRIVKIKSVGGQSEDSKTKQGNSEKLEVQSELVQRQNKQYVLRGDNCGFADAVLSKEEILGVLKGFWRGSEYIEDLSVKRLHPLWMLKLRDCLKKLLKRL